MLDELTGLFQLKIQNQDASYVSHIHTVIKTTWALVAARADWWFLESPDPLEITLTADVDTYELEAKNIGRMLHIADSAGRVIWTYKGRRQFNLYRAGRSDTSSGTTKVFTLRGLKQAHPVIQVYPPPGSSVSAYLHYKEAGTLDNLHKLPVPWSKVILHGGMSMIAPPKAMEAGRWTGLTAQEDQAFVYWLSEMVRLETGAADEEMELVVDDHLQSQLDEVNDLC